MGWGDVKLAALGGAVLGAGAALIAFAAACLVAVGVAWARGRGAEPIAFAPYLVASIGAALLLGASP
jgi:prepilin signal peptidase PulO-like enzyme (type II secretory pathway)